MSTRKTKHLVFIGIVIGTILLVGFLVSSKPAPPLKPKQETVWTVDVEPLQKVDRSPELELIGEVESTERSLLTSRSNTTVIATPYLAGRSFHKGDILLELDAVEVEALLTQRRADVMELTAAIDEAKVRHEANLESLKTEQTMLELSQKAYDRQLRLRQNNVTSEERSDTALSALYQQKLTVTNRKLSVDNYVNTLSQLQARQQRAQAQLTLAELDMAQTRLLAPYDGRVVAVNVAIGERVRPGDPLIELVATDSLEVKAQIPDRWVPQIQGMLQAEAQASAFADVYGKQVRLNLERIAAAANISTGGIDAYFRPLLGEDLPLGKPVELHVMLPQQQNAFTVQLSAIYGDDRIYLVNDESRLQAATIERLGRYRDKEGHERVIFAGAELHEGAQVITTQLPKAVTGLKVQPRQQIAAAANSETAVKIETATEKEATTQAEDSAETDPKMKTAG